MTDEVTDANVVATAQLTVIETILRHVLTLICTNAEPSGSEHIRRTLWENGPTFKLDFLKGHPMDVESVQTIERILRQEMHRILSSVEQAEQVERKKHHLPESRRVLPDTPDS